MWKPYLEKYEVNEVGDLRNSKTNRHLKHKINRKGYKYFGISVNGVYKDVSAHRAVAHCFVPNPMGLSQVNHKNGDKQDNRVENLEWVTPSQNMKHAIETGLIDAQKSALAVSQIGADGEVVNVFSSMAEAAESVEGHSGHISCCCRGLRNSHKGFKWAYAN